MKECKGMLGEPLTLYAKEKQDMLDLEIKQSKMSLGECRNEHAHRLSCDKSRKKRKRKSN